MSHKNLIKNLILIPSLTVFLAASAMQGCDQRGETARPTATDTSAKPQAADNTGRNQADRGTSNPTPVDQGGSESDRTITAEIRKAILAIKDLSVNGQNCKIITQNGVVTLRGPVETEGERTRIVDTARAQKGVTTVVNDLEVKVK